MTRTAQFDDKMTILEARTILRKLAMEGGHDCPVCTQFSKVYKRKIHASMAAAMVSIYRASYMEQKHWVEISKLLPHNQVADAAKLRYWGLIEEEPSVRSDGSERTGFWRVTMRGMEFVREVRTVPKYAKLYDGRSLGLEGDQVGIRDALGAKFNYSQLMAGT